MKGIQYIIDEREQKRAAIIDLGIYGHLWEDIHDILMVEARKSEPRVKWEDVKKRLHEKGLKHSKV